MVPFPVAKTTACIAQVLIETIADILPAQMNFLGWSKDEVDILLARARKEAKDHTIHAWYPLIVAYGQKPKG
jgi:hypothetical protein